MQGQSCRSRLRAPVPSLPLDLPYIKKRSQETMYTVRAKPPECASIAELIRREPAFLTGTTVARTLSISGMSVLRHIVKIQCDIGPSFSRLRLGRGRTKRKNNESSALLYLAPAHYRRPHAGFSAELQFECPGHVDFWHPGSTA